MWGAGVEFLRTNIHKKNTNVANKRNNLQIRGARCLEIVHGEILGLKIGRNFDLQILIRAGVEFLRTDTHRKNTNVANKRRHVQIRVPAGPLSSIFRGHLWASFRAHFEQLFGTTFGHLSVPFWVTFWVHFSVPFWDHFRAPVGATFGHLSGPLLVPFPDHF